MKGFLKDTFQALPTFPGWPLWLESFRIVARDAARGIAALKAKGISQDDIKPANIMLETEDRGGHAAVVKATVTDFGLAKMPKIMEISDWEAVGANVDGKGHPAYNLRQNCPRGFSPGGSGSPIFMAPENIIGGALCAPVGSADVWSLGVSLFIMLTRPCLKYPAGTSYKATSFPQNQDDEGLSTILQAKFALIASKANKNWVKDRAHLLAQVYSCDLFEGATAEHAHQAVDLLTQMLRWKPVDRITPEKMPDHPFFDFQGPAPAVPPRTSPTPSSLRMSAEDLAKRAKVFEKDWDKDVLESTSSESVSANKLPAAAAPKAAKKQAGGTQQAALRAQ